MDIDFIALEMLCLSEGKMFEISYEDKTGARVGKLNTAHGSIETPCFMPVATQGTIKTLRFDTISDLDYKAIISNAFILYLRPGLKVLRKCGGLHNFINWNDAIFTDSGGFQMLNPDFIEQRNEVGVVFRSPFDNSRHHITPEKCIEIQNEIGSDVVMVLDDLVPYKSNRKSQETAVMRTIDWAIRCKRAHNSSKQLLFAITQGGTYSDLRLKCAEGLIKLDFDGYAIGGLSIGEPKDVMQSILAEQIKVLPPDKPRYLMGVGSPTELLESISKGVDVFDSTFPTRNARHNDAYTFNGDMNISRGKFKDDLSPIEDDCKCYTCINHTRAYVHHLLRNHEVTGQSLMTIHNLFFIKRLFDSIIEAIKDNRFSALKEDLVRRLNQ
jgi:queuine tRNA-ribosyltransferase